MEQPAEDVSEFFWTFVHLAAALDFAALCETAAYAAMADAVHGERARGRLALQPGAHLVLPRDPCCAGPPPLPPGVDVDADAGAYTFADVCALFDALPDLLAPTCPDAERDALRRCRARIADTLAAFELAEDLDLVSV
jgi:hypothetical protein